MNILYYALALLLALISFFSYVERKHQRVVRNPPRQDSELKLTVQGTLDGTPGANSIVYDSTAQDPVAEQDVNLRIKLRPLSDTTIGAKTIKRNGRSTAGAVGVNIALNVIDSLKSIRIKNNYGLQISVTDSSGYFNYIAKVGQTLTISSDVLSAITTLQIRTSNLSADGGTTFTRSQIPFLDDAGSLEYYIPDGTIEVYFDQNESFNTFATVMLGGAAIGTNFIAIPEIQAIVEPLINGVLGKAASQFGVSAVDFAAAYASAFATAVTQGFISLSKIADINFHIRVIESALQDKAGVMGTAALLAGNKYLQTAGQYGVATALYGAMSLYDEYVYFNDTALYDSEQLQKSESTTLDKDWSVQVDQVCNLTWSSDGATVESVSSDTISSDTKKTYKQDLLVYGLFRSEAYKDSGLSGHMAKAAPEGAIVFANGAQTVSAVSWVATKYTITNSGSINAIMLKNDYSYPIGIVFRTTGGTDAYSATTLFELASGQSLTVPYELAKDIKWIYVYTLLSATVTLRAGNIFTYNIAAPAIFNLDIGQHSVYFDFSSSITPFTIVSLGLLNVAASQLPVERVIGMLSSSTLNPIFQQIAKAFNQPVAYLIRGYASAWAFAISMGWTDWGALADPQMHLELIQNLQLNSTTLLATAGIIGSTLLGGQLQQIAGTGGAIGFSLALVSSFEKAKEYVYVSA
jgi:hypothetical protein